MAESRDISLPDFDFSSFYYPEILRSLIQFQRSNVPEITDESDEEPFQQLLRSFALVGHLNNVLLDVAANETLLPTARLLESVRGHLALIDVQLDQAKPAQTDVVLEFSKVFTVLTEIVPANSQFATVETDENPQIIYENNESQEIERTDRPTAVYNFTAGKIEILNNTFEAGDAVEVEGVSFENGTEWSPGSTIAETLDNITDAINQSTDDAIAGRVGATNDGVSKISLIPLKPDVESISVVEVDNSTNNFEVLSAGFSTNKAGLAFTDSLFFNLFSETPKAGDLIYIGHSDIMWDTLEFVFNTVGDGMSLALEFFDNSLEDANPDSVTNLGSNLEFDLTTLLGTQNRKNTVVRVVISSTGSSETLLSEWDGTKNVLRTKGLLGQSTVSTNEQDYVVGTFWNEVSDVNDGTNGLESDGEISYSLPQSADQNWVNRVVNGVDAMWLRLRVVEVNAPVANPNVDRLRIDTGTQFLLVPVVQGQTVVDDPLGSSNGAPNQEFLLTFRPLIEGTLVVEVNEGSGFSAWNRKENFLSSNSASRDYKVEIDASDNATVIFGDGTQGKIPPPGVDNIRAIYRIGADRDGNVGSNTITVNKSGISFVNRVFNPRTAKGFQVKEGSTEQDLARLKIEGPATLRTLGRAITVADYEFLATQFETDAGSQIVSRALAIEETFGVKTIEVVVVGQSGILLTEAEREDLEIFFNGSKVEDVDPIGLANHEATVINYDPKTIDVTATVTGGNAEAITNAITALLNPDATFDDGVTKRWNFGQEVPLSLIIAEVFEVDPVNIKKVVLSSPQAVGEAIPLTKRQLPLAGNISVTVV